MVQDIRELNRQAVLTDLFGGRPASRKDIARRTGISPTTVTRVVDQLIADGLVREGGEIVVENRGRRARFVDFVPDRVHVVGIDLGASTTRLVATDLIGTPVRAAELPTPADHDALTLAAWLACATADLSAGLAPSATQVALGLPGAVGQDGDHVSNAPNLPQIEDPAFLQHLRSALPAPMVIDNDANYALLGEQRFGSARESPTAAMITLGAGLGSALAIGGRLLRGRHGLVGEFGQLPVGPFGAPLEHSVTGPGILRRALEAGIPLASPADLFLARPGEPLSALRAHFDQALLVVLTAIAVSCEPEVIVLGGGISKSLVADLGRYQSALTASLRFTPRLLPPDLGDFSGAAGAAAAALHETYRALGVSAEDVIALPAHASLDLVSIKAARQV